ncbi:NrfD/PsrC family molybdoenzyme membrane anchor subunit [Rhodohalobacter sp.]|uniref:NrfD/PsrC family molybdoenzyme membrane anchor subunit n=1 Tax=Rhodohalobacter sp. TaxID=1974210 RepID=UPI002ACDF035|nr:NrfD/PsrC family molybdoenzyme membrane anchor subunit [Rhodohalobacter sp.]MDZ7756813.1 NrfD/PsrC family molybdoenzyme membrane anchor subunit [Rhodohalobacter sp.]
MKFMTGERLAGYGSYVIWGLWVALYFHFVGIAGGLFTVGSIGYVLNIEGFRKAYRVILLVSVVAVITGLFSIWLDLGKPFRATNVMLKPNFGSMMTFNAWMYNIFLLVAVVLFFLTFKKRKQTDLNDPKRWIFPLIALGLFFSIAFPSQSGAFFGVVDAKPFWNSAILPIMFLISAITAGAAVLLVVFTFIYQNTYKVGEQPFKMLRYTVIGGVLFYFLAVFAEFSIVMWSPSSHVREAVELVLIGPYWWVFWIVHFLGGFIALWFLYFGKTYQSVGTGGFLIAVTFVAARLNVLIPGQAIPELKGLEGAYAHQRLSFEYHASLNEYLVALFIGAFGVALVYIGIKLLSKYTQKKLGTSL